MSREWKRLLFCLLLAISIVPSKADDQMAGIQQFDKDGIASYVATNLQHRKKWGIIDKSGIFVIAPQKKHNISSPQFIKCCLTTYSAYTYARNIDAHC